MKALTYVEVDVPSWTETSPETETTYRFTKDVGYQPDNIEAIPSLKSISFSPARISLGENLGERASLTIIFADHRHIMNGEPFDQGTFWGKWRGRYGTRLRGRSVRWITGYLGQALDDMVTRHFVIESVSGPTPQGVYTIVAKDALKLADGDRAQAPVLNTGYLISNIADDAAELTLSPSGIGAVEYAESGYVAIGGREVCAFENASSPPGDVLTLTERGALGTTAEDHESGDRVQIVLRYSGEDPADIIHDLLTNYAGVDPDYIDLTTWRTETETYLGRLYTATIAEPTDVSKLLTEIIEQAALALWWEPTTEALRLRVLRQILTDANIFNESNTLSGTLTSSEQPGARLSQVWTYFGQRDPLRPLDETSNFRSVEITVDLEAEEDYGSSAIKKIYSRWIPFGGRLIAERLNELLLNRYVDAPRKFQFKTWPYGPIMPTLGDGFTLKAWSLQTETGEEDSVPIMITRLNAKPEAIEVEAEEFVFAGIEPLDLVNRVIIIDSDINDVNLRTLHDQIYPEPSLYDLDDSPPINVTFIIANNVVVGSTDPSTPACNVGDWPAGYPVNIDIRGRIAGAGGAGGGAGKNSHHAGYPGEDGGTALYTRHDITVYFENGDNAGKIYGGGGGGAGGTIKDNGKLAGGGGGGAGRIAGDGGPGGNDAGYAGYPGTLDAGGNGYPYSTGEAQDGGDGGDPGQDGENRGGGSFGAIIYGGDGGYSIDGTSYVTQIGTGDIVGSEVN